MNVIRLDTDGSLSSVYNINRTQLVLSISPNPSTGIFTINSSEKMSSVEIVNLIGEKIYGKQNGQLSIINFPLSIDLSQSPKGIYFVEIIPENERSTKKIILE